jgi:hypothetical protein
LGYLKHHNQLKVKMFFCYEIKHSLTKYTLLIMSISDEAFREEYKPLHIPAHFKDAVTEQDKVIFALAQIGGGTAAEVSGELADNGANIDAENTLNHLFNKGLIKGEEVNGEMSYNLSKITHANDGAVDPDLLAPGLD